MNSLLKDIKIDIIMSTGPTLGRLLFNNNNKVHCIVQASQRNCFVCKNELRTMPGEVVSSVTGDKFKIDNELSCYDGGIYVAKGACNGQYSGKTIHFGHRGNEHFHTSKTTAVYAHRQQCNQCNVAKDFTITYVENFLSKGKYSLSEREYFWNHRIKGVINTQKTLMSA